ncbi:MAG: hypothetical protein J3Q66DRAFT_357410 [Benniella sp.]|nr:MAG: hypothetical protein J3Q66DRAFT_357410 [Benniella sp.]
MGTINPARSPAKPKGPNLPLSAVVTLAILLLSVLLPVHATTYHGEIKPDSTLDVGEVLQSPDGTKTLEVTDMGHLVLKDGNNQIWEKFGRVVEGWKGAYYLAFDEYDVVVYTRNDDKFYNVLYSRYGLSRLELRNNGILYAVNRNGAMIWTSFCDIRVESLKSGQELTKADHCLSSSDWNAFMDVRSNGSVTTYLGRTPQHTFTRPAGKGHSLKLSDTGALSITAEQPSPLRGILRRPLGGFSGGLLGGLFGRASSLAEDLPRQPHVVDTNKRALSDKDPFIIFNGTGVKDAYTMVVTKDAKISVKNSKGVEMWTYFPDGGCGSDNTKMSC